ncbi:MBL fold metallo-hydrolase [Streptomyces sp. NPDC058268]|uniref:MBL fold metallo-hydrolase n=1 Tax=Streptomyces sp. NPDC058268 TaxID=3346413 RepID=UPI0036E2E3A4
MAVHGGELLDNLARVGRRPQDIEAVAITHLHGDHAGWLSHRTPAAVCLPSCGPNTCSRNRSGPRVTTWKRAAWARQRSTRWLPRFAP